MCTQARQCFVNSSKKMIKKLAVKMKLKKVRTSLVNENFCGCGFEVTTRR